MKRLIVLLLVFVCATFLHAQKTTKDSSSAQKTKVVTKYSDNVDDRMKGPKGEKVYLGPSGGRYYLKNGKKIYVAYKGNKKKAA